MGAAVDSLDEDTHQLSLTDENGKVGTAGPGLRCHVATAARGRQCCSLGVWESEEREEWGRDERKRERR